MNKMSKKEIEKCQKIIKGIDFEALEEKAMNVEQWIENNKKVRENWKKRIKKVSFPEKLKKIRIKREKLFIIK